MTSEKSSTESSSDSLISPNRFSHLRPIYSCFDRYHPALQVSGLRSGLLLQLEYFLRHGAPLEFSSSFLLLLVLDDGQLDHGRQVLLSVVSVVWDHWCFLEIPVNGQDKAYQGDQDTAHQQRSFAPHCFFDLVVTLNDGCDKYQENHGLVEK